MSAQNVPWRYLAVEIIHIMLQMILNLVLQMVMLNVVSVPGPFTLPTIKMIVSLVVVISCHLRVGIIQKWFI